MENSDDDKVTENVAENKIYFLSEYNWVHGTLLKVNKKTYKIKCKEPWLTEYTKNVPKEKCAFPDEEVCVVWETWKGRNGRGGYRVEREKYPQSRIPAKMVPYSSHKDGPGRVTE